MRGTRTIIVFAFLLLGSGVSAQQTIPIHVLDTIELTAGTYRGSIQWQFSSNESDWSNISKATNSIYETVIDEFPSFFRAKITESGCDEVLYSEAVHIINAADVELWSDPATWGGAKPVAGELVTITADKYVLLDESTPSLGGLTIEGNLQFDRQDLELTSEWIVVMGGGLRVGSQGIPFEQKAIITLTDTDQNASVMGMGTRGIVVMSGNLELHGATADVLWTKIDAHADAGTTSLDLAETVEWNIGDEVVVAPTDYYEAGFSNQSITQRISITDISDKTISLSEGLNAHRWGLLQYATNTGMSLTATDLVTPPVADTENTRTPLILDERAEVGNLTRNIVIQAPNDSDWSNEGFGVHTMIMPGGNAHIDGVEFKRAGQRGRLRRYPFHWHMLSYSGSQTLADATGQYLRNSTVNSSANRGIVIHGTNGVEVTNNIVYDVRGHGIFTEDAVERRNVIDGNLILHVRNPVDGSALKQHEVGELGSSGFWISNPDNTVTNNTSADCQTFGFWLSYPEQPWGLNQEVLHDDGLILRPNRILFGVFDNNTAHSNRVDGIHLDDVEIDNEGNTSGRQYWSTTDGRTDGYPFDALRRFSLSRYKTWKNQDNGAWDRGAETDIFEVVSADNCGRFFAGSGSNGVIERSLVVGTSLNHLMNETGRPEIADFQFFASAAPVAFATYHSAFSMKDNVVVNFPVDKYDRAGVFASDDYYVRPVDNGQIRNSNNKLIASHPGVKIKAADDYFTLASAVWDPYGYWGTPENYIVYDDPFLTYGKDVTILDLGTDVVGGVGVAGPFYGFLAFVLHGEGDALPQNRYYNDLMEVYVRRLDIDLNQVADWRVTSAQQDWSLQHMRDWAGTRDGIYELSFPDESANGTAEPPSDFHMDVESMFEPEDVILIGIEFDGSIDPVVFLQQRSDLNNHVVYDEVGSLDLVRSSDGEKCWQDKANDRVWVKLKGGLWNSPTGGAADDFEDYANETLILRIRAAGG
ncbi:MAG: G8 domain-containing protein [Cyclobacteriaceae bacterium]